MFKSDVVYAVTSAHRTISGTDNCNLANFQYNFTTNTQAVFEMMVHSIPHLKASAARLPNKVCASGASSVLQHRANKKIAIQYVFKSRAVPKATDRHGEKHLLVAWPRLVAPTKGQSLRRSAPRS